MDYHHNYRNHLSKITDMKDKFILDACCGPKLMWINKNHPNAVYIDVREEEEGFLESRPTRKIKPDIIADFRDLPFDDKSFKLIVWDPPHLLGKNYKSRLTKNYGFLLADSFESDFKKGFKELWRCLDDYGVLIFKFNDFHIPFKKVLKLFPVDPLIQNVKNKSKTSSTKWFTFMKIPK